MLSTSLWTYYTKTAQELSEMLRHASLNHDALETGIKPCQLERCKGTCCYDGVYLSEEEFQKLEQLVAQKHSKLHAYGLHLEEGAFEIVRNGTRQKTKARQVSVDELADDFPEHFSRTRCVFLDAESRCGLQRLAVDEGKHPWFYKPLTCWIHPLVIQSERGGRHVITLVNQDNDPQKKEGYPGYASCTHCGRAEEDGQRACKVLAQEIEHLGALAGRDFLAELQAPKVDFGNLADAYYRES